MRQQLGTYRPKLRPTDRALWVVRVKVSYQEGRKTTPYRAPNANAYVERFNYTGKSWTTSFFVRPTPEGFLVKTDSGNRANHRFMFRPHLAGFELLWVKGLEE